MDSNRRYEDERSGRRDEARNAGRRPDSGQPGLPGDRDRAYDRDRYGRAPSQSQARWMWPVEPDADIYPSDFDEPRDEAVRQERRGHGAGFAREPRRAFQTTESFAGRGPRGYRRSDERILDEVNRDLTDHPEIDASDIEVKVSECNVTLSGTVPARRQKWLAEELIEGIYGVRDINNEIKVKAASSSSAAGTHTAATYAVGIAYGTSPSTMGPGVDRIAVREGMTVVGSDSAKVGKIKEVRVDDFLVDRPMAVDLFVPMSIARRIHDDQVILDIPAAELDAIGWSKAEESTGRASGRPTQSE